MTDGEVDAWWDAVLDDGILDDDVSRLMRAENLDFVDAIEALAYLRGLVPRTAEIINLADWKAARS